MRLLLGLVWMVLTVPSWAAISIDSKGIRIDTEDNKQVDEWQQKHREDCSTLKIGDKTLRSEGCDVKSKDKENRSVHGDNNPGKGHNKKK
ncbi:MAG: hypothetical protein QMB70_06170 [Aeromonadaceae bacterium]